MASRNAAALLLTLGTLVLLTSGGSGAPTFSYDLFADNGPLNWSDQSPEWALCNSGLEQSPIEIQSSYGTVESYLGQLNTSYVSSNAVMVQDGHAVQIDMSNGDPGYFHVNGEEYNLKQFHFHSPSEHTVDGLYYPLEMHLVHKTADEKIAVIGIFFELGEPSPFLNKFWYRLDEITEVNKRVDIGDLTVNSPSLIVGPSYARYQGSLTTPPCSEDVIWTLSLTEGNTVSHEQIAGLKSILPEMNFRPLQKLNGRDVQIYKSESALQKLKQYLTQFM